jgi:hypothetical protein
MYPTCCCVAGHNNVQLGDIYIFLQMFPLLFLLGFLLPLYYLQQCIQPVSVCAGSVTSLIQNFVILSKKMKKGLF